MKTYATTTMRLAAVTALFAVACGDEDGRFAKQAALDPTAAATRPPICPEAFSATEFEEHSHHLFVPPACEHAERVMLILFPGAAVAAPSYLGLARAIQAFAASALSVAIVRFTGDIPNPFEAGSRVDTLIGNAAAELGITRSRIFLAGHSLGGIMAAPVAKSRGLGGLVLLASYLPNIWGSEQLTDHPNPVLTLGGELDGRTWISRIGQELEKHNVIASGLGADRAAHFKPVVIVQGANHQQFASGASDAQDIVAEVTLDQAHQRIGSTVADFMDAQGCGDAASAARDRLLLAVQRTREMLGPYMEARQQEHNGAFCAEAQGALMGLQAAEDTGFDVEVTKHDNIVEFMGSKPALTLGSGAGVRPIVQVHSYNTYAMDLMDAGTMAPESAITVACKMKSRQAILAALVEPTVEDRLQAPSCADINRQTIERAIGRVSETARARFLRLGSPLSVSDDTETGNGFAWVLSELQITANGGGGYDVRGVALMTNLDAPFGPGGMHYCKLLSPARAIEWLLVEGLKR